MLVNSAIKIVDKFNASGNGRHFRAQLIQFQLLDNAIERSICCNTVFSKIENVR